LGKICGSGKNKNPFMKVKQTMTMVLLGAFCAGCSSIKPVTSNASPEAVAQPARLERIHPIEKSAAADPQLLRNLCRSHLATGGYSKLT
jgi:hypothetical protein